MNLSMNRIYDPQSPNLHGYRLFRWDPSFRQFVTGKLLKWWSEMLWSLHGRDRIVAWHLHREQSLIGKIENRIARQILVYLYGKPKT